MPATTAIPIDITDGTILSFNYQTVNFDSGFRFGVRKNITVQVSKINCGAASQGTIGEQAQELDDYAKAKDYIRLTVNGHEFEERFQITGFNLDEGDWTQITDGSITLESFEAGNLHNLTETSSGEDYAGWFLAGEDGGAARFLEDFSDSFTFNKKANGISYRHDVNFKFAPLVVANQPQISPPLTAGLQQAKLMLIDPSRPNFNNIVHSAFFKFFYDEVGPTHKRIITESVDEINNTVSATESFDAENLKDDNNYSFSAQQTMEITDQGIINISEKGTVIGLTTEGVTIPGSSSSATNVLRADPEIYLQTEIDNAINASDGRLINMFDAHKAQMAAESPIDCVDGIPDLKANEDGKLVLLEKGINRDLYRGKASYSIKVTNDPKIEENAMHEYTKTINAIMMQKSMDPDDSGEGGPFPYFKISQQGTFTGFTSTNVAYDADGKKERPKFGEAKKAWDAARGNIKDQLRGDIQVSSEQYPAELATTYNAYKGSITYSITYSSEPKYGLESDPFKSATSTFENTFPVSLSTPGDSRRRLSFSTYSSNRY